MRLARLDLTRYGKFTDRVLDFGPRRDGRPDLHLVYGPNEAGKSTAFSAFLDLLFGIETKSRYNFVHPYNTMRVGGVVEFAGGAQELFRVKRAGPSLFDAASQPLSEALVGGELGGIDRAAYRTMFSLDDETLEAGGNSILASRGDLGQLLFSASAGLAALSRTLGELRLEADGFHRPKKRDTALAELKARLADCKARRDALDTYAAQYAQLVAGRDRAAAAYAEGSAALAAARTRHGEVARLLGALPRLAALREVRREIAPLDALLAGLPEAPAGWAEELPDLVRREAALGEQLRGFDAELARLAAEAEAVAEDPAALALASRVDRMADLRGRARAAARDLPELQVKLRDADRAAAELLRRLGRPDGEAPERAAIPAAAGGALRGLIERRSGVEARCAAARAERDEARLRLAEAVAALGDAPADAVGLDRLAAAVAACRGGDGSARLRLAERALPRLADELAGRLRDLAPWSGDVAALAALRLPDIPAFEALQRARAEADARLARTEEEAERLRTERDRMRAEADALGEVAGVVGDAEAASLRAARERAWADHRARLDSASAEAFEDALRRDDVAAGARFGRAADVARLHALHLSLATLEVDRAAAGRRREAAAGALDAAAAAMAEALRPVEPPLPDAVAARLGPWAARRTAALAAASALRDAERDRDEAADDLAAARADVGAALAEAGVEHDPTAPLDRLLAAASAALDGAAALKGLRARAEDRRRDAAARDRALGEAEAADAAWRAAWAEACAAAGLDGTPSTDAAGEVLKAAAELGTLLGARAALAERAAAAIRDGDAFAAELRSVADALGMAPDGPEAGLDEAVLRRVAEARRLGELRAGAGRRLGEARERHRAAAEAAEAVGRRSSLMSAHLGVDTLAGVETRLRAAARRSELRGQAEAAAREIRDALRTDDPLAAEAALDGLDRDALEAERAGLEPRLAALDSQARELYAAGAAALAAVEAVGGDEAVARIEAERRNLLVDVEDQARRYLRLRAGVAAAEAALRAYRDRHRSAMMGRASDAFRDISRHGYRGLATQPEKDAEVLLGVAADGATKLATDMSKGTRFQLYLALRIAGYHEFARTRRPVPFVADDIMETFDDFRAEEAFRLFAGMAEVGQVIYLTHHRHLIDVARAACPAVTVHDLTAA
ncbi:YhaN family protein [Lichenibacterium dinghuense]|uniref:YhaN family protein n=1 Tax=Lichenibacterium dinghuense TaxID=2895977 RepID=UPI001F402749|nr:YhaN family protein [Lichenibacterium sp. 6Y81]